MLLGDIALAERRGAEAAREFRRALALDPAADALNERLARALEASGDAGGAAAARRLAGPREPAFGDPLVQGIFAPGSADPRAQALALAAEGRYDEARKVLDGALAAAPETASLLATYARIEGDAGRLAEARARADQALKLAPDDAGAILAGALVSELGGREAEAVAGYEHAVRADLGNAEARLMLGHALMRRGQFGAAAEQYRQIATEAPGDGSAWLRLAAAESRAGRCRQVLGEVNTALKARPRDGTLLQAYVRLAASCPGVSAEERQVAVDYGRALYEQLPNEDHSEALAMALAAIGRRDDAVDYQAQAIFEALKRNDQAAAARLKVELDGYKAGRVAAMPWPAGHPLVAPPRLAPSAAAAR
jgi:tetratricopeptide (TPR) repeat protein